MSAHIETGNKAIRFAVVERSGEQSRDWGPTISYHQNLAMAVVSILRWTQADERNGDTRNLLIVQNAASVSLPRWRTRLNLSKHTWPEYTGNMPWQCPF